MGNVSVAQTVERDPSNPDLTNKSVERLRQAVRVPRYSHVAEHKLTSADPWVR